MVRGRRPKALVTAIGNGNSPDPKRKVQKLGKLSHNFSNNKPQSITEFFQVVTVADTGNGDKIDESLLPQDGSYRTDEPQKDSSETPTPTPKTPVTERKLNMTESATPATPHRIELRSDSSNENPKEEEEIHIMPKPLIDVPNRGRKKLHSNQAQNQQNKNSIKESHKLTEYFPVRRSVRKTTSTVLEEKQRTLEEKLRKDIEDGLEVRVYEGKGRGVVTAKDFYRGDFVVEYSGDLIDLNEAKLREQRYAQNENTGCYMYYFKHGGQQYCIDATAETGRLGRLVNHSRNGNLVTRTVLIDRKPRLILVAKDDIKVGEEVTYDYGDRSKESLKHHPWLAY